MMWYAAIAGALLLCAQSPARLRTWAALSLSSLAGLLLPPVSVEAYIVVDLLAAALVLRRPAGCAQKVIGLLFAWMVTFHCGFIVSGQHDWVSYYDRQAAIGWAQLACLAAWGLRDVGHTLVHRWADGRVLHSHAGLR